MTPVKTFLSIVEVAEAFEVSGTSVRRWVKSGQLPVLRLPSGRIKVRREDVEAILRGGVERPAAGRDMWTPSRGAGLDADPEVPSITPQHYGQEEVA